MGVAYDRINEDIYASAVLKRHVDFGPLGIGGIYQIDVSDPASPVTTNWLNVVSDLGLNIGQNEMNLTAAGRGLGNNANRGYSVDSQAFTMTGKIGIGDINLDPLQQNLWFVNLFEKKIHQVRLSDKSLVLSRAIPQPAPACSGGVLRPWGLKTAGNLVVVGSVCDGSVSQDVEGMRGIVQAYDVPNDVWVTIFDFPLTYPKGYPIDDAAASDGINGWYPWIDRSSQLECGAFRDVEGAKYDGYEVQHPSPILSDIEFDIDGSMVLGLADRLGLQHGTAQPNPAGENRLYAVGSTGGDILRAYYTQGTDVLILENNAKAGPIVGYGPNNSQGPGLGEFYNDNYTDVHTELANGGLALRPGSGEVATSGVDVKEFFLNGIRYLSNNTGLPTRNYTVYTSYTGSGGTPTRPTNFTFNKGVGLAIGSVVRCAG